VTGESGDVVITDLHNYGMPFVRYKNGDRATLTTERCPCGRGLPMLANVDGRILDLIVTPDGIHVSGEFFIFVMLGFPSVRQFQFVQTQTDEIEVRIVQGSTLLSAEDKMRLVEKVREGVGSRMRINVREVAHIPPAPSGKRRVSVSLKNSTPLADECLTR
jgi:phenylacetate-CoA ligase